MNERVNAMLSVRQQLGKIKKWAKMAIPGALLIGLLSAIPAQAHKVSVFAWAEGDTIHTESKFSGGKYVMGGKIEVYDPQDKLLLEGRTDDHGAFSFPIPQKSDLKIVMIAGTGHTNHWIVHAEELGQAKGAVLQTATKSEADSHPVVAGGIAAGPCLNADDIEKIIQIGMEKKLAPLRAQLADMAWGIRDVISGLGYILGLVGLGSYMHYRKLIREQRP
jgi:nickel transport protein